ncbi:MAG: Tn3 family transposase, partial [Burkholderiales bacterium]
HHVDGYGHEADKYAKAFAAQQQITQTAQFKKAASIFEMFYDNQYDEFAFTRIKEIAHKILPIEEFKAFTAYLKNQKFDLMALEWDYYAQIASRIKKNLRPLLLSLDFKGNNNSVNLMSAYSFVKQKLLTHKSLMKVKANEFPMVAIAKSVSSYLFNTVGNTKVINYDKYEFWLYQQLSHNCSAGHLFVNDSNKYRNFDDDLVDEIAWRDKESIIKNLGYKRLTTPLSDTLDELEKELEYWIERVNKRFDAGENPHIKLSGRKSGNTWSLPYSKLDDPENHYVFKGLPRIGIADVIIENHKYCSLLECFTPMVNRYNKSDLQISSLLASIIAMGTFIGLGEMGKISDISYSSLASTTHSRIRLETLRAANDKASNKIAKLPISKHYSILEELIHASADGTKIETILDTFNSRCSPKYFGMNKGVSVLTLVINHIAANAKLIGSHEYEGNFIFDLVFNNTSNMDPDILSTDTHGTNAVNFIILYFFDYIFAPRYKDTAGKIDGHIYGFKLKSEYSKYKIKPTKKVNKQLILDEEDNIKKIMVSLATKATTQSVIISKLSSHKRRNRTKAALCELDNIIRSIHILRYIDDITYRQSIQKALNRGESYNKLRRAISYANEGKLNVHSEMSQQIYNECARFIANNIILYNARLLSSLLVKLERSGKKDEIEKLKRISP